MAERLDAPPLANADKRAASLAATIGALRAEGVTSANGITKALNERSIAARRQVDGAEHLEPDGAASLARPAPRGVLLQKSPRGRRSRYPSARDAMLGSSAKRTAPVRLAANEKDEKQGNTPPRP
jgi:hypothetical protein